VTNRLDCQLPWPNKDYPSWNYGRGRCVYDYDHEKKCQNWADSCIGPNTLAHCARSREFDTAHNKHLCGWTYIHTYITSRLFPFGVTRDHFLPLATIITHTFRFFHCHQIPHTRSTVSGTLDLFTRWTYLFGSECLPCIIRVCMYLQNIYVYLSAF
jgi:hypothetical protein